MKRAFSSTTRTCVNDPNNPVPKSDQDLNENLVRKQRSESEETDYYYTDRARYYKNNPVKEAEHIVDKYILPKKPIEKGPFDYNNEQDVDDYSPDPTSPSTPELRERYGDDKEGLKGYIADKKQINKDNWRKARESVDVLWRNDYYDKDHPYYDEQRRSCDAKYKQKKSALRDREQNLNTEDSDNPNRDNPNLITPLPIPEHSDKPEASKRKLTDSSPDSELVGKRQKTEQEQEKKSESLIDAARELESTDIPMYDDWD